jgi:hypothetical protein
MLIAGVVLLLVAAGALWFARSERADARKVTATETLGCGELSTLSTSVAGEVGGGSFRQRCEVVGKAEPGEPGVLKSPESGADAVWHRSVVTHKYWEMEDRRENDRTRRVRVEKEETVSDIRSDTPFLVRDDSGTVIVSPAGADVDEPERVVDRFERREGDVAESVTDAVLGAFLRVGNETGTIGFKHEEWIIRPGARLYVHGEATDATGQISFAKPGDDGDFIISSRTEADIVGDAERNAKIAAIGAAVAALAGLGLIAAGLAG